MALSPTLVAGLFGLPPPGSAGRTADPATAIANLRRVSAPGAEAKALEREAKDPITIRAIDRFRDAVAQATDLDTALEDPRIMGVLLPALGLADQASFPGLVKRALLTELSDPDGLLASLGSRFQGAAATLNLAERGLDGLKDPANVQTLADGFLSYGYRSGLDEETAGLSDALYVRERAGGFTDAFSILGDPVMRRVVTGALGLPPQLAVQSVESQARTISSRLDIDSLQDPKEVEKLVSRYLINRASEGGVAAQGLTQLSILA